MPQGSEKPKTDWREQRRFQAWRLAQKGWSQTDIAEALGVSGAAVSKWIKKAREGGVEALQRAHRPGPQRKLELEELQKLPELLEQGAESFGFRGDVWTTPRIAAVIERTWGVSYHKDHVSRLMKELGWSPQKPKKRATQRDENAIERWRKEKWPVILKHAKREKRQIFFVDEAAFYLLPGVARTYAPRGQTPVLRHHLTRDHLSVISAISPSGQLLHKVRETSFKSEGVRRFLQHLLNKVEGKVIVIWDGAPIHRSKVIKAFLADGAAERLHLERLPGYAPDLNPDEGVWNWLKNVEMKNMCVPDLANLKVELRRAVERLRHKVDIIKSFFGLAKLPLLT